MILDSLISIAQADSTALRGFFEIIGQTFWLLLVLVAPLIGFTILIHFLERLIQLRLTSRFGWKSVLWTGWLGTPIHELSHAILCKVFRHRIDEIALFEPDLKSGRLGFVRHSWNTGNWFEEVGNFFIGMAPLVGGSLALAGLLWFFYPEATQDMIANSGKADTMFANISALFKQLIAPAQIISWKFWLFTYLVLCVSSHMAPSLSDYEGASRGVRMVVLAMVACLLLVSLMGFETDRIVAWFLKMMRPVFALQLIAIVICAFATLIVHLLTALFPVRYSVS